MPRRKSTSPHEVRFHDRLPAGSRVGFGVACSILALVVAVARTASADAPTCISAHATGQRQSNAGHLRLAERLFTACGSDESCPDPLRKECAEFLQSVKRAVPSVIFSVLDEGGGDVSNAKVYAGDELLADGLDGRALEIDPGRYHLRFALPDGGSLGIEVLVREGEKDRLIQVKKARVASNEGDEALVSGGPHKRPAAASARAATWIAAVTSAAALGTGITLALVGTSKKDELEQCKPGCPSSKQPTYDAARSLFLGADVAFGAAAVAAGVATWLFVAGPADSAVARRGDSASSAPGLSFGPAPVRGGGAFTLEGNF